MADVRTAPSNVSPPCALIHDPCVFPCEQRIELRLLYIFLCQMANQQNLRMYDRPAAFALTLEVQYLQSRQTLLIVTHVEVYRNSERDISHISSRPPRCVCTNTLDTSCGVLHKKSFVSSTTYDARNPGGTNGSAAHFPHHTYLHVWWQVKGLQKMDCYTDCANISVD